MISKLYVKIIREPPINISTVTTPATAPKPGRRGVDTREPADFLLPPLLPLVALLVGPRLNVPPVAVVICDPPRPKPSVLGPYRPDAVYFAAFPVAVAVTPGICVFVNSLTLDDVEFKRALAMATSLLSRL